MGLHRLEIEVNDELLSRIDRVSEDQGEARERVILEALSNGLPPPEEAGRIDALLAFQRTWPLVSRSGRGLTMEQIDADVRAFRED
jgi:predicted transcriptional regulator